MLSAPSAPALAIVFPSGDHASESTAPLCWRNDAVSFQVRVSHSLTYSSPDPDARTLPSGENATQNTGSLWPLSSAIWRAVCAFQTLTMQFSHPAAIMSRVEEHVNEKILPARPLNKVDSYF